MRYRDQTGRKPDFRVRYQWLPQTFTGTNQKPFQHMRCDFAYDGDDIKQTGIYMIWPEFEDASGEPLDESSEVPTEGTATMWIVSSESRQRIHSKRIRPGVRGYFMLGSRRLAEAEVLEVIDLITNIESAV